VPRPLVTCLCLAAVAVLGGCGGGGGGGSAEPKAMTVSMKDLRVHPATVAVRVGETVTWRNDDSVDHNVTATRGASFHSRAFGANGTYRFTPTRAGTVAYVCTLHPGMEGTLRVGK
jgi:plastocyanin